MAVPALISLVTLGVRDLATTTAFYEAIGFPKSSASVDGEVSFFRTAGCVLALWGVADLSADAGLDVSGAASLAPGAFRGSALAINLGSREAVDDAIAEAGAAGGRVVKPAQATDWGGYSGYFADPEGNLWEVAHNPFWPTDERGLPVLP